MKTKKQQKQEIKLDFSKKAPTIQKQLKAQGYKVSDEKSLSFEDIRQQINSATENTNYFYGTMYKIHLTMSLKNKIYEEIIPIQSVIAETSKPSEELNSEKIKNIESLVSNLDLDKKAPTIQEQLKAQGYIISDEKAILFENSRQYLIHKLSNIDPKNYIFKTILESMIPVLYFKIKKELIKEQTEYSNNKYHNHNESNKNEEPVISSEQELKCHKHHIQIKLDGINEKISETISGYIYPIISNSPNNNTSYVFYIGKNHPTIKKQLKKYGLKIKTNHITETEISLYYMENLYSKGEVGYCGVPYENALYRLGRLLTIDIIKFIEK
jgi:hypothetical protein